MAHFTGDTGTILGVLPTMGTPTQRIRLGEVKVQHGKRTTAAVACL
jgi:hypothetical protein